MLPADFRRIQRWDLAATAPEPCVESNLTVRLKMARSQHGVFYVEHVERMQASPLKVEEAIKTLAVINGKERLIGILKTPARPGSPKSDILLPSWPATPFVPSGRPAARSPGPPLLLRQGQVGNIKLLRGSWNETFLNELENFPGSGKDDQVDAFSGAFNELLKAQAQPAIRRLHVEPLPACRVTR
jgi:phage terminase large subunit-like protein